MTQSKIQGKFYALQEAELINLRESKLINNAAYVYFALKIENPFCDRPIEIHPKQFALKWNLPESSVYNAIAKLKKLKLFTIKSGKLIISWITGSDNASNDDTVKAVEPVAVNEAAHNKEVINKKFSDPRINSQIREKIIKIDNELSDPIEDYQIRENRGLKALADIAPACLQTIQNFQKIQTNQKEVEQNNFQEKEVSQDRKLIKLNYEVTQSESKKDNSKGINNEVSTVQDKKVIPQRVVQKNSRIPDELKDRLETLGIPLDKGILNAIANHHISQAYGAAAHVENSFETIKNPRGVFLFQLPKQKIEQLGARLPEIGAEMRKKQDEFLKEMSSAEYKKTSREAFAKLRARLGGKNNERR